MNDWKFFYAALEHESKIKFNQLKDNRTEANAVKKYFLFRKSKIDDDGKKEANHKTPIQYFASCGYDVFSRFAFAPKPRISMTTATGA